jgi:putative copper export protein
VLAPAVEAVRLTLHVLAAALWVGGQLALAGLVPAARRISPEAPKVLARAFSRLAWPAFVVVVLTGFWNIAATHPSHQTTAWQVVLWVKLVVVALSGVGAWLHQRSRSPVGIAVWGAVAALGSVAALAMGVLLAD